MYRDRKIKILKKPNFVKFETHFFVTPSHGMGYKCMRSDYRMKTVITLFRFCLEYNLTKEL